MTINKPESRGWVGRQLHSKPIQINPHWAGSQQGSGRVQESPALRCWDCLDDKKCSRALGCEGELGQLRCGQIMGPASQPGCADLDKHPSGDSHSPAEKEAAKALSLCGDRNLSCFAQHRWQLGRQGLDSPVSGGGKPTASHHLLPACTKGVCHQYTGRGQASP